MTWTTFREAEDHHGINAQSIRSILYVYKKQNGELPTWAKHTDDGYHVLVDVDYLKKVPAESERLRRECGEMANKLIEIYGTGTAAARVLSEATRWKFTTWATFISRDIYRFAGWKERRTVIPVRLIEKHAALSEYLNNMEG